MWWSCGPNDSETHVVPEMDVVGEVSRDITEEDVARDEVVLFLKFIVAICVVYLVYTPSR